MAPGDASKAERQDSRAVAPMRKSLATKVAIDAEPRRTPRELRKEHHDACAKTIRAGTFAERRQGRSSDELHKQQDELQRQWESR